MSSGIINSRRSQFSGVPLPIKMINNPRDTLANDKLPRGTKGGAVGGEEWEGCRYAVAIRLHRPIQIIRRKVICKLLWITFD